MPRPLKHPSVRQRTNGKPSSATLHVLEPDEIEIPELPVLFDDEGNAVAWLSQVRSWWQAVWASPMAPEYHKSDIHGLYSLAFLRQKFWQGNTSLHGEIRLYEQQFGMNPLARRRLEWTIDGVEKAQEATEARHAAQASSRPAEDSETPYAALA